MRFIKLAHLGTKDVQDQRLAVNDDSGDYYLYDWSGNDPSETDDGPLRIALDKPIEVEKRPAGYYVGLVSVHRNNGALARCSVTLAGLAKMARIMVSRGDTAPTILYSDPELHAIRTMPMYYKRDLG